MSLEAALHAAAGQLQHRPKASRRRSGPVGHRPLASGIRGNRSGELVACFCFCFRLFASGRVLFFTWYIDPVAWLSLHMSYIILGSIRQTYSYLVNLSRCNLQEGS